MDTSTTEWASAMVTEPDYVTMVTVVADGETDQYEFNFPGDYLNRSDIKAYMLDESTAIRTDLAVTFVGPTLVKLTPAQPAGVKVTIYRDTPKELPLVDFTDGAMIEARNLDRNAKQCIFAIAELLDRYNIVYSQVELAELYANSARDSATSAEADAEFVRSVYERFEITDELIAKIEADRDAAAADAEAADQARIAAVAARTAAEAARDATEALTEWYSTYPTVAAGLAATTDGQYFRVPQGETATRSFIYYRNNAGVAEAVASLPGSVETGYQYATATSSVDNTIDIVLPGLLANGSLVYFESPIQNTGAVTVNVTDVKGNSVNRIVLRGANSPLAGGELLQYYPVLCVYRGAPVDNFKLVASGPMATEVAASLAAYRASNDALTATLRNQVSIPVVVSGVVDDVYTATSTIVGGELQNGRLFLFTPPSANTTRAPKMKLNTWGAYNITRIDGGQVAVGDLAPGRAHLLHWHSGSNSFRVMTYADERTKIYGTVLRATFTSDASTPNDLAVTVDGYVDNGTLVLLEPPATNTGPVAITVVNRYGDQIVRSVFKGANAPLVGGELQFAQPVMLMYRGAPQNNFKIVTSGDLSTPVAKLQADVETLKTSFTDPYVKLAKKLIGDGTTGNTGPFGSISFTNGVRSTVKRRLVCTSIGSSVGVGAGSTGGGAAGAPFAPNTLFVAALRDQLAGYGNFDIVDDNQCIPTQAIQQFSAQLQNSPYFTSTNENDWPDFVLIVGGMNDAPVGNFNNGLTYPSQKTRLESLIDECKAKGAVVIVATSPHHNPLNPSVSAMNLGALNVSWPIRTFSVDTNYTFDAVARTINGGAFSYGTGNAATSWGGQILRVGHTLRILSGANAGDYTISAISADRNTITVAESFPASGLIKTTIRHIGLNSLREEILEPPPSKSFIERDWSGGGVRVLGDARFGIVNSMFRAVARDKSVFLMECEKPWFRRGVEVHGWNALFDGTNYNHPNDLGYTVSYKAGADKAAYDLCNLIYGEKYYTPE